MIGSSRNSLKCCSTWRGGLERVQGTYAGCFVDGITNLPHPEVRSAAKPRRTHGDYPAMTDAMMPLWEVFIRAKAGLAHRHVGSVHAADPEMALQAARDVYTRRGEGVSLWVVPSASITASIPATRRRCSSRRRPNPTVIRPSTRCRKKSAICDGAFTRLLRAQRSNFLPQKHPSDEIAASPHRLLANGQPQWCCSTMCSASPMTR